MARQPNKYPEWVPPIPKPSEPGRAPVNDTTRSADKTLSLAADGSAIPVVYGRAAIGPLYFAASMGANRRLYLGALWCIGEIEGLEAIYNGDKDFERDLQELVRTNYVGTTDQLVDSDLAYAIEGYEDALIATFMGEEIGYSYSVLRLSSSQDLPSAVAVIQGRKVRDPRDGSFAWTDNPALCLADFLESPMLGLGKPVNDASLIDAANFCDEMMEDGSRRATINLAIVDQAPIDSHIETLRAYAQCWVVQDGAEILLIPQRPGSASDSLDDDSIVADTITLEQISTQDQPTVVGVRYTDQSTWPWAAKTVTVQLPDVQTGAIPWRESVIDLPGLTTRSEAYRTAVRRLNYFTLINLRVSLTAFDAGLQYHVGDILSVTHQWGLTNKLLRVISANANAAGRWALGCEEYDSQVYSDVVQTEPETPDTGLPPVDQLPEVTGLAVTEVLYRTDKQFWASRLEITWLGIDDTYVYPHEYRVHIDALAGPNTPGGPIAEITTGGLTAASPPVQEKVSYRVKVRGEALWGNQVYVGDYVEVDFIAQGKFLPPGDVPEFRGLEAGGEVFLEWSEAVDIDIWRYEIRYGRVDLPWDGVGVETATLIDRVDGLRHRTKDIPEGTWDIMIKALDSVGNYSATETRISVTVSFDPSNSQKARYDYTTGDTVVNMVHVPGSAQDCWVTSDGGTWDATLPNLLDSYTDLLVSYHGVTGGSSWQSERVDWGRGIPGTWSMPVFDAEIIGGGDPGKEMQLSVDDAVWEDFPSLIAKDLFQYSRAYASTAGSETLKVCVPTVRVEISSTPKTQTGEASFDGVTATKITLNTALHTLSSIQVTPTGAGLRSGVVDNVITGDPTSFDVMLYDETAGFVAGDFFWDVKGI